MAVVRRWTDEARRLGGAPLPSRTSCGQSLVGKRFRSGLGLWAFPVQEVTREPGLGSRAVYFLPYFYDIGFSITNVVRFEMG